MRGREGEEELEGGGNKRRMRRRPLCSHETPSPELPRRLSGEDDNDDKADDEDNEKDNDNDNANDVESNLSMFCSSVHVFRHFLSSLLQHRHLG